MSRVLLVGCTGCGRTTVGTLLAQRLGWPFLDDDALLERTTGVDVRTLYTRDGEQAVRQAQAATLTLLLAVPGPLVASVPNGVLEDPAGRARLRAGGHVVWLRAAAPALVRRVARDPDRPWLGEDPAATLARLVRERAPLYAEVAHQVVDADVLGPGQLARAVVGGLPAGVRPERRAAPR